MTSRRILAAAVLAAGALTAHAQSWVPPGSQVTFVVPYAPGGITDIVARVLAAKLSEDAARPVVVENRTGAASRIATEYVAKAKPDGLTFLIEGPAFTTNQTLYDKLPYDSEKDFVAVALLVRNPLVLVTGVSKPYKTAADLIAAAKAAPGKITMGSGGNGVLSHMAQALTAAQTGTEIVHVPYKGGAPAAVDTQAGHIDSMWDNPSSSMPHIKAGRLRPLAVSGRVRSPVLPDVAPLADQGYPNFEANNWFGMFAPSKVPAETLRKVYAEVSKAMDLPDVRERFARDGVQTGGMSQEEFAAFVRAEARKWGDIIRKNGIKPG